MLHRLSRLLKPGKATITAKPPEPLDRRVEILSMVGPACQRGLEIGPLDKPIVRASDGDISYVDHQPTNLLREKFLADPDIDCDNIVDVHHVWGDDTLSKAVGAVDRFDYVIASHVIEHVPDLLGWLKEVTAVLKPGGVLSLAVPDKRFTFDLLREPSTRRDVLDAYLQQARRPSVQDVSEHYLKSVFVDPIEAWAGTLDVAHLQRCIGEDDASGVIKIAEDGGYVDVHVWVFTADTFIELIRYFIELNLLALEVARFVPTQPDSLEFFVTLRKKHRART